MCDILATKEVGASLNRMPKKKSRFHQMCGTVWAVRKVGALEFLVCPFLFHYLTLHHRVQSLLMSLSGLGWGNCWICLQLNSTAFLSSFCWGCSSSEHWSPCFNTNVICSVIVQRLCSECQWNIVHCWCILCCLLISRINSRISSYSPSPLQLGWYVSMDLDHISEILKLNLLLTCCS